jgi:DUF1680 family protein
MIESRRSATEPTLEPHPATTTETTTTGTGVGGSASGGPALPSPGALAALRPLGWASARLHGDGLLGRWQERNARATLPHCLDQLEAGGALGNLRIAPGSGRRHVGMVFTDSDIYKTLEALAWHLAAEPADEAASDAFETLVDAVQQAQEPDGYLNSYVQHVRPGQRWADLEEGHELYCAGHLIQAAVAAARAGVGERLLPIARRFADLLVRCFGPDGRNAVCGHPEIETALVELYRETGHRPYLTLAQRFVDLRGRGLLGEHRFGAAYFQDHRPVREAAEFTGHAVRQVYLLAGAVDVAVETGDVELLAAAERLWGSAFRTKTYITGAHGSRHRDEAVGDPYELPPDRAYAETCAAIGSFQWNWRLLLATGKHRYAEEMERALYNAIAVSTAQDGAHFFYSNPLHLRTGHDGAEEDAPSRRLPWYTCACCPPNLARLLASLHCYTATTDETGVQVHLYAAGRIDDGAHSVEVETGYPWDGGIALTVSSVAGQLGQPWTLALRIPAWCRAYTVLVDGVELAAPAVDGYVRLTRDWAGERVELRLAMPPRVLAAHPRVDAVRGCVALARGPLVYSIEQHDLPDDAVLEDVALESVVPIQVGEHGADAAIPVTLTAAGRVRRFATERLYQPLDEALDEPLDETSGGASDETSRPFALTAIPYFLWGNRNPGPMRVWIPAAPRETPTRR